MSGNLLFCHVADIASPGMNLDDKGRFGFNMVYLGLAQCISSCTSEFKPQILHQGHYSTLLHCLFSWRFLSKILMWSYGGLGVSNGSYGLLSILSKYFCGMITLCWPLGSGSWHPLRCDLLFLESLGLLLLKSMAAATYFGHEVLIFCSPLFLTPCFRCSAVLYLGTVGLPAWRIQAMQAQGAILDLSAILVRVFHRNRTNRMYIAYLYTHMIVGAGKSKICKAGQQSGDPGKSWCSLECEDHLEAE